MKGGGGYSISKVMLPRTGLPVLVELDGKVPHGTERLVNEGHLHADLTLAASPGATNLQALALSSLQPRLSRRKGR